MNTRVALAFLLSMVLVCHFASGKDYVLTIGGGYAPEGNQASLEANVIFFQQIILDHHAKSEVEHQIYFADGEDPESDLQIVAPKPVAESQAIALLNSVFDFNRDRITYRNHEVPSVRGPISPSDVRAGFHKIVEQLKTGDRLIVYVTAHGGAATGKDKMDTSIACWNQSKLQMKEFSKWLDEVPSEVPVIMVMAQCYCGGFTNVLFDGGNPKNGLSGKTRVGFFAQRHDLPAAGCRPDIANDEEYSSYFWGAFRGRLRSGKDIADVDCNDDRLVSFSEAHAFAVRESPTIDIPLKTSDEFLRRYSRIAALETLPLGETDEPSVPSNESELSKWDGTIDEVARVGSPETRRCILGLANALGLSSDETLPSLLERKNEMETEFRQSRQRPGRGGPRGPRGGARGARKRDFRMELVAKWPELEDPKRWKELDWLQADRCDDFLQEVRQLPTYEPFQQSQSDRNQMRDRATSSELKLVQYQRLIYSLESNLLAKNFPKLATVELANQYRSMKECENSGLDWKSN